MIPREVREKLDLAPGDTLVYRYTNDGVLIEKAQGVEDDPFATFTEWASPEDDEAFSSL